MTHFGRGACLSERLHKSRPRPFQSIGLSRYDAAYLGGGNETALQRKWRTG